MSSSQQQPGFYPNTATSTQAAAPPSHSDGSFGMVFIVLAIIVAVSALACFLGRFCSRRRHNPKDMQSHGSWPKEREGKQKQKQNQNQKPEKKQKFHGRDREGDIEFGFGNKGFPPPAKPFGKGQGNGFREGGNGELNGAHHQRPFAGEWEPKMPQY
ncbi:uncharacterized protein LOC127797661 [Diospyros lotus]|uniref:uncharacterized protein LOC127797661 n=1 Tax=Diospyros lotus TaxID=55363 RepID=UPI002257BAFE|nr:uncharacterized protein LOC127797661 [Diospyros lotus]